MCVVHYMDRGFLLFPLFGVSIIGGSTVHILMTKAGSLEAWLLLYSGKVYLLNSAMYQRSYIHTVHRMDTRRSSG